MVDGHLARASASFIAMPAPPSTTDRAASAAHAPLRARVVAEARRLGFDAVGIARADLPLTQDFERYETFLDQGMQGDMDWLGQGREIRRRVDTSDILEGARSVICLARRYVRSEDEERADPETSKLIARYARGRDYHNGLRKKLRKLAAFVRSLGSPEAPVSARPLCDEEPILERAWAARAGLGFVGKNGLLIVPGVGSMVLLGEVVTTLTLPPDEPIAERCGSCTRCLDACPTDAFAAPFVLDARRCIAYLTIEARGPVPVELRPALGEHLFGCDDCQLVCPFNAGARRGRAAAQPLDPRFLPDARWANLQLVDLLALDAAGFADVGEGSPVHRATREGLARNAALVLGARADERARPALERAAREHESATVRDAARWALERIDRAPIP